MTQIKVNMQYQFTNTIISRNCIIILVSGVFIHDMIINFIIDCFIASWDVQQNIWHSLQRFIHYRLELNAIFPLVSRFRFSTLPNFRYREIADRQKINDDRRAGICNVNHRAIHRDSVALFGSKTIAYRFDSNNVDNQRNRFLTVE